MESSGQIFRIDSCEFFVIFRNPYTSTHSPEEQSVDRWLIPKKMASFEYLAVAYQSVGAMSILRCSGKTFSIKSCELFLIVFPICLHLRCATHC